MERIIVILSVLLVAVNAGPIQLSAKSTSKTCPRSCTGSNKFNYIEGRTYNYKYDSDIKTQIQGASEDMASLHLSANIQMEVLSKCELSMRLSDVTLTEYDPEDKMMKEASTDFKAGLERFPVRFSFQDGGIEDICLSGDEPTWVLNAKRGIISLFQNNMDDFTRNHTVSETDVSGVCDTEYSVGKPGYYTTSVSKSKNLLGCTDRHGYNTAIQGIPYTAQSDIQSLPLLKSDHNCVHEIDKKSGVLKSVECKEQHVFRPFSKSDSGAIAINTQTLTYRDETTGTISPAPIKTRVSLKFDHVHDVAGESKSRKDITRKLMEICERTKAGVRPETPKLFTDLVYMMKSADIETLSDINKMLKDKKLCSDNLFRTRKFFLDALPMTGTSASLNMITELITSNEISGVEADMWLTTLSFIKNPTKDMLKEVKPLINAPAISEKAMLSVGTLVHSYCFYHGDCENDNMVKAIVSAFVNKMAKGCKVRDENAKTTLAALRGIGNAGYASTAIKQLSLCMELTTNPIEIRLSAIEAFRRMPCGSDRLSLMKILQDIDEDSEIRIAAYKVLMECPSNKVLGVVRNTLAKEEVNQVGSYIWTHLTNLMETSDRHKQDIRAVLEDETFKKEFDLDKRKFSRNYEGSAFIERINTGAKIEGDLIWSSKSFIPRSGMMNLTFDLFGHSVNLFEIGGRAEGLEYFMESFFGPNGYFKNPEADTTNTKDMVPKNIRPDKLKKIDKRFTPKLDDLRGSLYMRVFGNELRYMNFKGIDSLLSGPDFNLLDMLIRFSEDNDYTFTHSAMFMDSTYIVPTSSGFPLNLTVNGTATVDLKMKGKMDLRHPPALNIAGRIHPSAAIDISSMMSVDAFVTKSGVKMVSTLHTNTALEGKITIDEKGSISSEYEMPEPRMEIIDVKSSFFTVHRDTEREQKMVEDNRQTLSYCSSQKVVTYTGLELCAEIEYPNASKKADAPYFPLTGPVSAGVYLYNRDTHVKYILEAKSIHNKDKNIVHFKFDTPGSRIERHVAVDFGLNKVDHTVDAALMSPWADINIQGIVLNTKKASGLIGKLSIDEHLQYSFDAKLVRDVSDSSYIYKPSFELQANNKIITTANGMMTLKKNFRQCDVEFSIDGEVTGPFSTQFSYNNKDALMGIQGSIGRTQNKQYSFNIHLATTTYKKKVLYKPLVSIRTPITEVMALGGGVTHILGKGLDINLVLDKVVAKKITLKGKVNKVIKRRRSIYNTKLDFTSGPADFALKAKFDKRAAGTLASDIDFTYVIGRVTRNNLKLVSKITNQSSKSLTKAKANVNFGLKRNPELSFKILGEVSHNKKHTEIDGHIWYGSDFKDDNKHIDMRFEMNRVLRSLMNASADIDTRVRIPALNFITTVKGAHSHDDKNLNSNLMFKFGKGQPIETKLKISDNTNKLMKVDAEYQLNIPGYNIDIEHVLEQTVDNRYISTLTTVMKKGQESEIITIFMPDSRKIAFNSDIKIYGKSPAYLKGTFGLDPSDFITSLSFEKDSTRYAGSLTSATEMGKSSWLTLDIFHPSRHVVLSFKGKKDNDVMFGDVDMQFNTDQKMSIKSWFETPTSEKLNGSLALDFPSRTVILNAHLTKGSNYLSHVDLQWDLDNKITADTDLIIKDKAVIGSATFTTPFKTFPKLAFETQFSHDSEQYNVESKLQLEKSDTLTLKAEIKKPISVKTLVGSFTAKSSKAIYGLKTLSSTFNHKLSNSLASDLKFTWNRQFIQTTIILQNKTKGLRVAFDGKLDLKTSYVYMKKGKIILSHNNNGRNFNTDVIFNRNKRLYKMASKFNHQSSQGSYDNSGSVKVNSPYGNMESSWNHRNTAENIATTFTSTWGKNKAVTGRFTSSFDESFNAKFQLQTPFSFLRETSFETSLINRNGLLDSRLNVSANGHQLGLAEIGYSIEEDKYSTGLIIKIADLNVDTKVEASANLPGNGGITGSINASISPKISMSIEGSQHISEESGALVNTLLQWRSSFPGYEQIRCSYEVLAANHLSTRTTLLYKKDKEIKLETNFAFERNEKLLSFVLQTPFESLPKFQGSINVQNDLDSFKTDAYIEAQPVLAKTAAQLSWNTKPGLESNIRIDLPLAENPYFQAGVNGSWNSASSAIQLNVEYMTKKVILIEESHSIIGSELSFSGKAKTPFGTVAVRHSGKSNDFTCKLSLEESNLADFRVMVGFTNTDETSGTATLSIPGRRDIKATFTHSGNAVNFKTRAEIQHNRKNYFVSDLSFAVHDNVTISFTGFLKTQAIFDSEEYQTSFDFNGIPLKFDTHGEFSTTSLGKSQTDIKFDIKTAAEGSLVIKSKLMKNVKASFNYLNRIDYMESKVDIIHGGEKIIDFKAYMNRLESLILEVTLISPVLKDITFMSRFDGGIKNFVIRSEGKYGQSKADAEFTSQIDIDIKTVQQKIRLSATGMHDISAELNHNGDINQFKSYGEINKGSEKHRLDVDFSSYGKTEGSFSLVSPYILPYAANFQHSGNRHDFKSHAELKIAEDISVADLTFRLPSIKDVVIEVNFRSPFLKDVTISLGNVEKAQELRSSGHLSIEDMEDFDLKLTSTKQPLSFMFALKTPIENFTSFETSFAMKKSKINGRDFHFDYALNGKTSLVDLTYSQMKGYTGHLSIKSHLIPQSSVSFELIGELNNFTGHADYNFGEKKSEIDIFYNGSSRKEGLMTITSHLIPDLSVGFEHDGTLEKFKSHGECSIGFKKREFDISVNVQNDVAINMQYKCPVHGLSTAAFTNKGELSDFTCHAEITSAEHKWEGDISFSSVNNIRGLLELRPSYSSKFDPLTISFEQSGTAKNFKFNSDFTLGNDKTTHELKWKLSDRLLSTNIKMISPYMKHLSVIFKLEGQPKNIKMQAGYKFGSDKIDTDFTWEMKNSSATSAFSVASSIYPDITGNFNIQGILNDFSSNIDLIIDNDENSGYFNFKKVNADIDSAIEIKSAYMDDIRLELHHSGNIKKFSTNFIRTIAGKQNNALVKLNLMDDIQGKISLDEPLFLVEGSFKKGVISASMKNGSDDYSLSLSYSLKEAIIINGRITTPFEGYKSVMASYKHHGKLRNFRCTGKLEIEGAESVFNIKLNTEKINNLDCSLDITSPYTSPIDLKINNIANAENYISTFEYRRKNQKALGLSISATNGKKMKKLSISLTLNDKKHEIFEMSLSSSGLTISSDINSNSLEITFTQNPKLVATFSLNYKQFPTIHANVDLDGTSSNFVGSFDLNIDSKSISHFTISLNTIDKITASFNMDLPLIDNKEFSGDFSFIPGDNTFKIEAKMTNDFQKLFEVNINLNTNTFDFKLESNRPHKLSARITFTNVNQNIKMSWELIHAKENLMNGNIGLTMTYNPILISGTAAANTFDSESNATILIDQSLKSFKAEGSFKKNKKNKEIWSVFSRINANNDVDAEFSLTIPNMEDITGTLVHTKRTYRSKTNAELRLNATHHFNYDMELKWRNGLDGVLSITTPFEGYENIKFKTEHEGSFPSMKSSAEIQIAEKVIAASATFSQKDSSKAEFTLSTPFKQFENLALSMYHDGELSSFRTGGKLVYAKGEDIEIDLDHMWIGMTQHSKVRFMSPYTDEIVVNANHSGTVADFSSAYEMTIGTGLEIISKTSLKTGEKCLQFSNEMSSRMSGKSYDHKFDLKHDGSIEKFKTEASLKCLSYLYRVETSFQLDPIIEGSVELVTPFENFKDIKAAFTHTANANNILTTGEIQFAPLKTISGKIDILQYSLKKTVAKVELMTPFENMKLNKFSYSHSIDLNNIYCVIDSSICGNDITGTFSASKTPLSINIDIQTPFKGFETVGLNGNFEAKRNTRHSRLSAKSNPTNQIVVEGEVGSGHGEISITTPFKSIRDASMSISVKQLKNGFLQNIKIIHNDKSLFDIDVDHSLSQKQKHIRVNTRAPRSMRFEVDGEFSLSYTDFDIEANWNTEDIDSRFSTEISYDIRTAKTMNIKLKQSKLPGKKLELTAFGNDKHSKADLSWGPKPEDKLGYEIIVSDYDGTLKLDLPSRSLKFFGSHRGQMTEGSFMWDANGDKTKKISIQCHTVTASDISKASIVVMLPSLGKNVQVGSEISVNQGRVIFDGKTELSYSGDSSKKLVLTSKLEDISTEGTQNYSLSFGVSHPYTTLGVTVNTNAGRSRNEYTAGIGLQYLTVRKDTKKFHMGARIDKLMKAISFELQSPIKSISISGRAQTDDKFRLSLLNIYDQRQPLSTTFTFDRATRSIDFVTNFDEDKPRNEFHINMKYVNSTAISAEVYHIVRYNRVTDVLITTQLKTSHILHNRLHWRPQIMKDLQAFTNRKLDDYHMRLRNTAAEIEPKIVEEVTEKFRKIWGAVEEEIGKENIAAFEAAVVPYLDLGLQHTIALSQPLVQPISDFLLRSRNEDIRQFKVDTSDISAESWDYERLIALKQTISNKFNLVSEKMKLPAKHIPRYVNHIMSNALNYTTERMPTAVASQMVVLKSYGIIDAMEVFVKDEILAIEKEAETKLRNIEEIIMGHLKSPFTVYDPAHGEIQMELYSFIPLYSLDSLPALNAVRYIEKLRELKKSLSNSIPDVTLPDLSGEWMPPFTGVASVSLGHEITTFDGYIYDLSSDCTYILSRDYVDGNFTLVLSNDGYTTLTVLSSGKPISINLQGELLLDGKPADVPFTEGNIRVTKDENDVVTIKGGNHFSVDYDLTIDHMKIEISGWYHGRTGGLLGIYDNEPSNDKMTSFNKVVESNDRFARTWQVGTASC